MAKPDGYVLSPRSYERMIQLLEDYEAGKLTNKPGDSAGTIRYTRLRMAKVTGSAIPAATTTDGTLTEGAGQAQLLKADWTDSPETPVDISSAFPVELPVDTKMYAAVVQGKWRVIQPIITCPE